MESHAHQGEHRPDAGSAPRSTADRADSKPEIPESGEPVNARTWGLALAAGILAGVCAALATESVLRAYRPSLMPRMKAMPTTEDARLLTAAQVASGTVAFGAMGGLLGLAFGLAGGLWRRSLKAGGMAGVAGAIAGAVVAAGVAWAILSVVYTRVDPQSQDLVIPLLYHEGLWSVAGAIGGLVFGLGAGGRSRWLRTALGGWVGAALGTLAYEMVGALVFPTHRTQLPLSGSAETRALAALLVGLGAAIGIAVAARAPQGRTVVR
jgi:hypothetical protein